MFVWIWTCMYIYIFSHTVRASVLMCFDVLRAGAEASSRAASKNRQELQNRQEPLLTATSALRGFAPSSCRALPWSQSSKLTSTRPAASKVKGLRVNERATISKKHDIPSLIPWRSWRAYEGMKDCLALAGVSPHLLVGDFIRERRDDKTFTADVKST